MGGEDRGTQIRIIILQGCFHLKIYSLLPGSVGSTTLRDLLRIYNEKLPTSALN